MLVINDHTCRYQNPVLSLFITYITGFATMVARRVPHIEQELLTLPEHPIMKPIESSTYRNFYQINGRRKFCYLTKISPIGNV